MCQVRGLLTVSDRLSNRRLLGETGHVPKVQLKASHTVQSKHIWQMVKKLYNIRGALSAAWFSFRDSEGSALTHSFKISFNATTFIWTWQVEEGFLRYCTHKHMHWGHTAIFGGFIEVVTCRCSRLHFSFCVLKSGSRGATGQEFSMGLQLFVFLFYGWGDDSRALKRYNCRHPPCSGQIRREGDTMKKCSAFSYFELNSCIS